ncbi:MAG: hypothetical protein MUF62_00125 [Chitinophagaceae bacterium]|nr:hypothetical protein [Chitinophagaceae bacterium]
MKVTSLFCVLVLLACQKQLLPEQPAGKDDQRLSSFCGVDTLKPQNTEQVYGCTNTAYQMQVAIRDSFLLITNAADYQLLVKGSCTPVIDFDKYCLLIGKRQLQQGLQAISYQLYYHCPKNCYEVQVKLQQHLGMQAPNVTWHLLLPKLASAQTVEVKLTIL